MEMQQEFHSVSMTGAASADALELSSSSSSSSSSASSSPDNNSSIAPPPPPPPLFPRPLLLRQAEQISSSCSILIIPGPAPAPLSTAPCLPLTREQALKSLKESIPHTMILQQLQKSERGYHKDASWHKKAVRRLSKELYLIVSMYALLQGVLFTAVAQSSVFSCADRWGPAVIVVTVTLGTIHGTMDKLRRMGKKKEEVKKFERRQSAVYDKIEQLYARGSECSLESLEPAHTAASDVEPGMGCIFSAHGLFVLGFLVGFSLLIVASCMLMLCPNSCHCSQ